MVYFFATLSASYTLQICIRHWTAHCLHYASVECCKAPGRNWGSPLQVLEVPGLLRRARSAVWPPAALSSAQRAQGAAQYGVSQALTWQGCGGRFLADLAHLLTAQRKQTVSAEQGLNISISMKDCTYSCAQGLKIQSA